MTKIRKSTILVTGGAGGIGKLMAEKSLAQGATRAVIWDINSVALQVASNELRAKGFEVYTYKVDVANIASIEKAAKEVAKDVGDIDILFNNAGIVVGKEFKEQSTEEIEKTIRINVLGVMHVARVFLPRMIARKRGHIVNIASAAGLTPNPKMSVYAASKWAVLGWSESLRLELERVSRRMKVTTVTPSYIGTGMFNGVKMPILSPVIKPDDIVDQILKAVKKNQIILRAPSTVNLLPILRGILPTRLFDLVIGEMLGVYHSMDSFKGKEAKTSTPPKKAGKKKKVAVIEIEP